MNTLHRCLVASSATVLLACNGSGQPAASAVHVEDSPAGSRGLPFPGDRACAVPDADGELQSGGQLVQLDVELRFHTTRHGSVGSGDTGMQLDAEGLVQATSSQLACRWENYGYAQFDLRPRDPSLPAFPVEVSGQASLNGLRVIRSAEATLREEVAVSGPVEALAIQRISVRDASNADQVCVMLRFSAPLEGEARRSIDAGPASRVEEVTPSVLAPDGYSALAVERYIEGEQSEDQFAHRQLSICAGQGQGIDGLRVSADDLSWHRQGPWSGHLAGPNEQRDVSFRMQVGPPRLSYSVD